MTAGSSYEEARKQQLEENKKRLEDLGILKIRHSLSLPTKYKKPKPKPKPKPESVFILEPRRSSRLRNPVASYCDQVDTSLPPLQKRSKLNSSWASYLARPIDEVRTASYEERVHAIKAAEEIQSNLQSGNPSFVKSMVRSHVYSCFWLGLPSKFCEEHLPKMLLDMVLEDENGTEHEATYIGKRTGLSSGWRAFALYHKLNDGDALVFELIEPARFKVYMVRALEVSSKKNDTDSGMKQESRISARLSKCKESEAKQAQAHARKSTQKVIESISHQGGGVNNKEDVGPTRKRVTRSMLLI